MQLKKGNLKYFTKRIPLLEFPKTFRDAITVCKALNIHYLWIDCLCIIQDSQQDWEEQSGKMVDIYSNASLTIAADAAENSEAGFLKGTREEARHHVCLLSSEYQIFARRRPSGLERNGVVSYHYTESTKSWLADRGWTLQETILSPRVLHYTGGELSWQCASSLWCECEGPHPNTQENILRLEKLVNTAGWDHVIEQYSGRHLTRPTDKLSALAGLAALARSFRPGRYLGGLWENDLPGCLLWTARGLGSCERIQPTMAPSWSWACLIGQVITLRFWGRGKYTRLENVMIDYPAMDSNPYGSVPAGQQASLTATAILYNFRVRKVDNRTSFLGIVLEMEGKCSGLEPILCTGLFDPDTREDLDSLKAGEQGLLMDVCGSPAFIILRRLGECDCTFQRMGLYRGWVETERSRDLGKCAKKRITII